MNRIEKILKEALWMAYCSGRAGNKYIPEEVVPDLMKRCQLFPQPLEDEGLREKLTQFARDNIALFDCQDDCPDEVAIYENEHYGETIRTPEYCNKCFTKRLLALLPDIEEAREQVKILALQAIADEPEFPGDIPDELWQELEGNRINTQRAMQNGVRLTKNGITERFLQALSGKERGRAG